ncbi:MAG: hypothetical protein JJ938_06480 [Roseicyclus sp.]|nr:hypothetical protein [Roseicyclus sp.]MBO6624508.1 hypothetical protein [Roseicyclus sp.]MBO6921205.1 hypothetical protein [Roseicyclus sp.]
MPKKKNEESQKEQSDRFREAVRKLVAAGELSPTEADDRFERAMEQIARSNQDK